MVPTLEVGQRVLVDRVTKHFSTPAAATSWCSSPRQGADDDRCGVPTRRTRPCPKPTTQRSDTNFIKRVVGLPGDHLKVIEGRVYINGKQQKEPSSRPDATCEICNLPARDHHSARATSL